jgi:hypothetical protein
MVAVVICAVPEVLPPYSNVQDFPVMAVVGMGQLPSVVVT